MYSGLFDSDEKPYYSSKKSSKKRSSTRKRKYYKYRYAQPTNYDEECLQREFWDIKDGLGGF